MLASQSIVLGTAQLGFDYGVANHRGKPSAGEAFAILDAAWDCGVRIFDTASAYGVAEAVIGEWALARGNAAQVITKTPALSEGQGWQHAREALENSRNKLKQDCVAGLLLHQAADINRSGIRQWAMKLLSAGAIKGFGVSVYQAEDIPNDPVISIAQIPLNVFIQNAAQAGPVNRMIAQGGKVFVRSILVQGLVGLPADRLPSHLIDRGPYVKRFQSIAAEAGVSPICLAIACARHLLPEAQLILGADNALHVYDVFEALRTPCDEAAVKTANTFGKTAPQGMFDPRSWNAGF